MEKSLKFVIKFCLDNFELLEKKKKAVGKVIQQEIIRFNNEYIYLTSVKGIGSVITTGLTSEISGISKFDDYNTIAKLSGF